MKILSLKTQNLEVTKIKKPEKYLMKFVYMTSSPSHYFFLSHHCLSKILTLCLVANGGREKKRKDEGEKK